VLDAVLPAHGLPDTDGVIGLSAVIETADGQLSYWALAHRARSPTFTTALAGRRTCLP
jgi:hypothetical protein